MQTYNLISRQPTNWTTSENSSTNEIGQRNSPLYYSQFSTRTVSPGFVRDSFKWNAATCVFRRPIAPAATETLYRDLKPLKRVCGAQWSWLVLQFYIHGAEGQIPYSGSTSFRPYVTILRSLIRSSGMNLRYRVFCLHDEARRN
jgi:hypothetical protein